MVGRCGGRDGGRHAHALHMHTHTRMHAHMRTPTCARLVGCEAKEPVRSPVGGEAPGERVGGRAHRHEVVGDEDPATVEVEAQAEEVVVEGAGRAAGGRC